MTGTGPVLRVDQKRRPILAYRVETPIGSVFVETLQLVAYQNGTWGTPFGSPTTNPDAARFGYGLALDSTGNPTLVWTEAGSDATYVHVASWTGSGWDTSYPPLDATPGSTPATYPHVRIDKSGRPVVAWIENTGTAGVTDVFVARWTGSIWDHSFGQLGLSSASRHRRAGPRCPRFPCCGLAGAVGKRGRHLDRQLDAQPRTFRVADPGDRPRQCTSAPGGGAGTRSPGRSPGGRPMAEPGDGRAHEYLHPGSTRGSRRGRETGRCVDRHQHALFDRHVPLDWHHVGPALRSLQCRGGRRPSQVPELEVDVDGRFWVAWQESGKINVWKSNY